MAPNHLKHHGREHALNGLREHPVAEELICDRRAESERGHKPFVGELERLLIGGGDPHRRRRILGDDPVEERQHGLGLGGLGGTQDRDLMLILDKI